MKNVKDKIRSKIDNFSSYDNLPTNKLTKEKLFKTTKIRLVYNFEIKEALNKRYMYEKR